MATTTTLGQFVNGLLGHITQLFNGRTETGVDIGLPYHTPVYSLVSGPVVGAGFYGGGGVVTVQSDIHTSNYSGAANVYTQHLSDLAVAEGQTVQAGQLIGWSGGQLGYGDHPSSPQYSTGPHIEVGINAPYGGIWGRQIGANVNPLPLLNDTAGGIGGGIPIGGIAGGDTGMNAPNLSPAGLQAAIQGAMMGLASSFLGAFGLHSAQDFGWRALLVVVGVIVLIVAAFALTASEGSHEAAVILNSQAGQAAERAVGRAAKS